MKWTKYFYREREREEKLVTNSQLDTFLVSKGFISLNFSLNTRVFQFISNIFLNSLTSFVNSEESG